MRWTVQALGVVAAFAAAASASGQVVISQVDGSGGLTTAGWPNPYDRDFVELFNRGSTPVNLAGWSLQLWGRNITDTYYWTSVASNANVVVRFPRQAPTYGPSLTFSF